MLVLHITYRKILQYDKINFFYNNMICICRKMREEDNVNAEYGGPVVNTRVTLV